MICEQICTIINRRSSTVTVDGDLDPIQYTFLARTNLTTCKWKAVGHSMAYRFFLITILFTNQQRAGKIWDLD